MTSIWILRRAERIELVEHRTGRDAEPDGDERRRGRHPAHDRPAGHRGSHAQFDLIHTFGLDCSSIDCAEARRFRPSPSDAAGVYPSPDAHATSLRARSNSFNGGKMWRRGGPSATSAAGLSRRLLGGGEGRGRNRRSDAEPLEGLGVRALDERVGRPVGEQRLERQRIQLVPWTIGSVARRRSARRPATGRRRRPAPCGGRTRRRSAGPRD